MCIRKFKLFIVYGGFGNQAFQVNRAVCERAHGSEATLLLVDFMNPLPLSHLFDRAVLHDNRILVWRGGLLCRLFFKALVQLLFRIWFPGVVRDSSRPDASGWLYCGYWQDSRYGFDTRLVKGHYSGIDDVAVHVRGGDYKTKKNNTLFADLKSDYYVDAIRRVEEAGVSLATIRIITNDLEYARELADELSAAFSSSKFLISQSVDYEQDFTLLAGARAIVGANSTFSLIASHFGEKQIAVFPKVWFRSETFKGYPPYVVIV